MTHGRKQAAWGIALICAVTLAGCPGDAEEGEAKTIDLAAIPGVEPPVAQAPAATAITATAEYSGAVSWTPGLTSAGDFLDDTRYTATITLVSKSGWTLKGVAADFFSVAGAELTNNAENKGVVTAEFPPTANANNQDFLTPVIDAEIIVRDAAAWTAAKATITTGGDNKKYVMRIDGNITGLDGATAPTFGSHHNIRVSLRGAGSLSLAGGDDDGPLIRVGEDQTVTLRGPGLTGKRGNNKAVVYITGDGAAFTLAAGTISGNTVADTDPAGGGVEVSGAAFTMSGGTISGNTVSGISAARGGGVALYNSDFTMTGGTMSGNTVIGPGDGAGAAFGGGLSILGTDGGTFSKSGGVIYGKNEGAASNTAVDGQGHAAYAAGNNRYRDITAGPGIDLGASGGNGTGTTWGL